MATSPYELILDATVTTVAGLGLVYGAAPLAVVRRKFPQVREDIDVVPAAYVCPHHRPENWQRFSSEGWLLVSYLVWLVFVAASNRDPELNLGDPLVAYKVSRVIIRQQVPEGDATNSEGEPMSFGQMTGTFGVQDAAEFDDFPYASTSPGVGKDEITLENAAYDPGENRFDTVQRLKKGSYVAIEVRPIGLTGIDSYEYPAALITEMEHTMNVQKEAMQPVTIKAVQDGRAYHPGEAR
jgi:hypothetical protein